MAANTLWEDPGFLARWHADDPSEARAVLAAYERADGRMMMLESIGTDTTDSDLDTSMIDLCMPCQAKLAAFYAARKRKRPSYDTDRMAELPTMSTESRRILPTIGGLDVWDDDATGIRASDDYTVGGLNVPDDREPSTKQKLMALFNEKPNYRNLISEEAKQYRECDGGLLTPDW